MEWPTCPACGSADEVQRASVAVAAGRGWATWRGLALRLSDPTCPRWDAPDGALSSYRWGWLYGAVAVAMLLGGAFLPERPLVGVIVMVAAVLIGLIIAVRRLWDTRTVIKYNRAVAAWNKSVNPKWHDLHYCHRCDRVFVPGHAWAISPEEWRESLGESPHERWPEEELARTAHVVEGSGPPSSGAR